MARSVGFGLELISTLERADRDGGREGGDGVGAAEDHGNGERDHQRDGDQAAHGRAGRDAEEGKHGGQAAIHQHRVAAEPGVQGGHGSSVNAPCAPGRHPGGRWAVILMMDIGLAVSADSGPIAAAGEH